MKFLLRTTLAIFLCLAFAQFASAAIPKIKTRIDAKNFYYSFNLIPSARLFRIYLDTDSLASTGFRVGNIGANFMIENGKLFRYNPRGGKTHWTPVKNVAFYKGKKEVLFRVAKSDIGNPKSLKVLARCIK